MKNQTVLFDCIHGLIRANQKRKAGLITEEEFALAQEGFKELTLLAKQDALGIKGEGPAILKLVDNYLFRKFPNLAKKLIEESFLEERYLMSVRLNLCSTLIELIGTLVELIKNFSLKNERHIATELAVELEILKKIYQFFQNLVVTVSTKEQTKLFYEMEASQRTEHYKMENLLYHSLKAILNSLHIWAKSHEIPHTFQSSIKKISQYAQNHREENNQFISHLVQPNLAIQFVSEAIKKVSLIIQSSSNIEINAEAIDKLIAQSALWHAQQWRHWTHFCFNFFN